jgi:hypothetical protein
MTITLNHTIVPAHDKSAAAHFFARIFHTIFSAADPVSLRPIPMHWLEPIPSPFRPGEERWDDGTSSFAAVPRRLISKSHG